MVSSTLKHSRFFSSRRITLGLADLTQVSFPFRDKGLLRRDVSVPPMKYRPDIEGEFGFEISRIAPREGRKPCHCGRAFLRAPGVLHLGR
ncbi:hypothetical protein BQ8794_90007 [Mesorhizobium prunaredense]|uniref:Uncharacterized protein n=1 Tax=Mesorhizobium prunaredense TaxID=1631249 RepID=A0A1R3VLS2_9HYPH|nr:hypothetical protein BQ8794_90007 [Mesorhizobium prunaredense]